MGAIKLEPRCPKSVNGLTIDPNPNWSFGELLSELNSLEVKLSNAAPFTKTATAGREASRVGRREKAFVMRVNDFEFDDDSDGDDDGEIDDRSLVPVGRFVCNDVYLSESDESEEEDEKLPSLQVALMDKIGVVEGAFHELTHEHQLGIKEEIRNQLTTLETKLVAEKEKCASALVQVEKKTDARREMDRKLDMHYQRKIAEALDNHLTAIQRDHEHKSLIEERKIRADAALEEAKRKEKALQEEKLRQQKAMAEEELRREAARRAEEERKAAEEAQRAKEAADKLAKEKSAESASTSAIQNVPLTTSRPVAGVQSAGALVRAAENALKLEERRLQYYKDLEDRNKAIISGSNMDFRPKEREIARRINQISGSIDNVRSKVQEFVKIFNDPGFPQSVTVAIFAKKVISTYETPNVNSSAFACGLVIVYVSAQVPAVMDCLLAEFNKACFYSVPKHIVYKKTMYETKESYLKAIGFREEDGELESIDSFLQRLRSCMKLYGAIVQTEPQGIQNTHGLEEGWAWLARFLNVLPANLYTAVALESFLRMAGFSLHRKYGSQFRKILNVISQQFVHALKKLGDPEVGRVITRLQEYIELNKFLEEPEGWRLQGTLLSRTAVPQEDRQQQYYTPNQHYYTQNRRF